MLRATRLSPSVLVALLPSPELGAVDKSPETSALNSLIAVETSKPTTAWTTEDNISKVVLVRENWRQTVVVGFHQRCHRLHDWVVSAPDCDGDTRLFCRHLTLDSS